MSAYIGKDNGNNNIIHMTTDEQSLSTLKGDPTSTSILHSKYKPLNVVSDSTYNLGTLSVGYQYPTGYLVENEVWLSSADAALITAKHMWLPYFIQNSVVSTSKPINQYAIFSGIHPRSASYNAPQTLSLIISVGSYGVSKSAGQYYVPPENYTIGILIFNHKYTDSLSTTGGPVLLKNDSISVGSTFDLSADKFFCYNKDKDSVDGDKVILSSVSGEPSYNYKNFSGSQTSDYQVTLDDNIIKRNVNGVLRDFIGGSGGRMILPYEKRSWTKSQLEPFMNLTYSDTSSVMSNSDCTGFSYVIFVWKVNQTYNGSSGSVTFVNQRNGIFFPVSSSVSSQFHHFHHGGGGATGSYETSVSIKCSSNLSQINITMVRTPYSQTSSTSDTLNGIEGLDAYFIK